MNLTAVFLNASWRPQGVLLRIEIPFVGLEVGVKEWGWGWGRKGGIGAGVRAIILESRRGQGGGGTPVSCPRRVTQAHRTR